MKILYKCSCMQDEGSFEVQDRGEHEDLLDWMNTVQIALGADHRKRSPLCMSDKTEYVKIYLAENAEGIGRPNKLDS